MLKEEMMQNPSEKVVDAIILYLILRIDLLNEQLTQIKKLKNADSTSSDGIAAI